MATGVPPRPISRNELAKFLPTDEAIRKFERLFQQVDQSIPLDLDAIFSRLDENQTDAGSAQATANQAVAQLTRMADALERLATEPKTERPNLIGLDALEFNVNGVRSPKVGQLSWNLTDDTLNLVHSDGVTLQIGLEEYLRGFNNTGTTIPDGAVVYVSGSSGLEVVEIAPFIADGSIDPFLAVGILTQSVADGEIGRVTVYGKVRGLDTTGTPYGETWANGDVLYASPNTAGDLTNIQPTAPDESVPIGFVVRTDASDGIILSRPLPEQQKIYGEFIKTTDQTTPAANTAYAISLTSALIASGITLAGTPTTRVTVSKAGLYNFQINTQVSSASAAAKTVYVWFRKNGVDIADSALQFTISGAGTVQSISRGEFFSLQASDYIELMYAATDTNVVIDAIAATGFSPAAPATLVTVTQIQQ